MSESRRLGRGLEALLGPISREEAKADGALRELAIGSIERDGMRLHVAQGEDLNVLGMNFLSSLERWGVEGRWLVLQP